MVLKTEVKRMRSRARAKTIFQRRGSRFAILTLGLLSTPSPLRLISSKLQEPFLHVFLHHIETWRACASVDTGGRGREFSLLTVAAWKMYNAGNFSVASHNS